jgi:hypothetical protein
MGSFGRQVLGTIGTSIGVLATEEHHRKPGGVTIDWATVAAVAGADFTQEDGLTVPIGDKMLRYGQLITRITASGKYGPYDPAAADGRQTLTKGAAFVVEKTVVEKDVKSDHPSVIDGGIVFLERILQTGVGAHTLAGGPTLAEFTALFPLITFTDVED